MHLPRPAPLGPRPRPHLTSPLRQGLPSPCHHPSTCGAFWNRGKGAAAGDAAPPSPAQAPPPKPNLPAGHTPVVVRLPVLEGDTTKSLARRHGLSLATVRAAAGHKSKLPPAGSTLAFLAPASLGPRAVRAAGDLASSLTRGVPPPAQPLPWTASMAGPLTATARMAAGLALVFAGCAFWGGVGNAGAAAWKRWGPPPRPGPPPVKVLVDDDEFDPIAAEVEAAAVGLPGTPPAVAAADPGGNVPPRAPAWAQGGAPPVWRLGRRGDLGSQPVVRLDRPGARPPVWLGAGGDPPEAAWLCFEAEADVRAWGGWLAAGPARARPDSDGAAPPEGAVLAVTPTSGGDLSLAAMASGRPLALIPASAGLSAALAGTGPSAALAAGNEAAVLAWLSAKAHPERAGTACLSPADRARLEAVAAAGGEVEKEAGRLLPATGAAAASPPPPGARPNPPASSSPTAAPPGWWRDLATDGGLPLAWVPVVALEDGGRGFLTLASAVPGGPPTAIAFESEIDAADLARAWVACGAADGPGGGTPLEAVIGMEPAELASHLDVAGAVGAVIRTGGLSLVQGGDAGDLADALLAAAAGQMADDLMPT